MDFNSFFTPLGSAEDKEDTQEESNFNSFFTPLSSTEDKEDTQEESNFNSFFTPLSSTEVVSQPTPLDEEKPRLQQTPITIDDVGYETPVEDDREPTSAESQDLSFIENDIVDAEVADLSIKGQEVLKDFYESSLVKLTGEQAEKTFDEEEEFATKKLDAKQADMLGPGLKEKYLESRKLRTENKDAIIKGRNLEFRNQLTERYNALNDILSDKEHVDSKTGKEYSNPIRKQMVLALLDKGYDVNSISHAIGAAEFSPFLGTALGIIDVPATLSQARQLQDEGETGMARAMQVISGVEIVAGVVGAGFMVKGAKKLLGVTPKPKTNQIMKQIVDADITTTKKTVKAASKVAGTKEGRELSQQFIKEFEASNEVNVTNVNPDTGELTINPLKARDAGRDTANEAMRIQMSRAAGEAELIAEGGDADRMFTDAEAFLDVGDDADALLSPILKPEKFNAIVSIASDFKKANPNDWDNKKTVIDNLFDLTVGKNIDENQALADSLRKYGMTFDEYVMTVVSGGSDAGKILNQLSQIKRAGHLENVNASKNKAIENKQNSFMRGFRRLENIRRGGMVSMIKTAARNLQSAIIRAPMEALENIMDNSLVAMQNDGVIAGGKALLDFRGGWKGSLSHLKYMYQEPVLAKKLTDHILDRPEFEKQYTNLFDNVNEYQKATGRGEGGAFDTVVSKLEDVVTFANTPNRIQEYLVRRGAFMGEMERLVKREYDIDLVGALKDGKLRDLMANSSSVRPKGKAKFEDLVETSIRRALDVTYAKSPDVKIFRDSANFITRNGLTTVIEFPRFMFNSLELMGQYSAGAFNPALQRIFKMKKGPIDRKDRQNITRNMTGLMAITAAYQYRTSGEAPASYEQLNTGGGTVMDTSPQFPLRQMLWIGEATNQLVKGTYNDWGGAKVDEILETFGGSSMRTGASNVFIDQIGDIISDAGDVKGSDDLGKLLGATIGNYVSSWGVPIAQVIEAQRISGDRPMTYEDRSGDYELKTFGESFKSNFSRSIDQRYGNLTDPSAIKDMPVREGIFDAEEGRSRVGAIGSGILGITRFTGNSEDAEYLIRKGFNDWELGSRDPIKKVRNEANKRIRKDMPTVVGYVRQFETQLRKKYMDMPATSEYKQDTTIDQYVNRRVRPMIKGYMRDLQSLVKEAADGKATLEELATRDFNKMPKESRERAVDAYKEMQDGLPKKDRQPFDMKNGSHLIILKTLDKALGVRDSFL